MKYTVLPILVALLIAPRHAASQDAPRTSAGPPRLHTIDPQTSEGLQEIFNSTSAIQLAWYT
jgi:hypothetical protein